MKLFLALCFYSAGLLRLLAGSSAEDTVRIHATIYIAKIAPSSLAMNSTRVQVGPASTHWAVFSTPAKLKMGDAEFEIGATKLTRIDGGSAPSPLTEVQSPVFVTRYGLTAEIKITDPVEYFEKLADGEFRLHRSSEDSPETPHYDLALTPRPVPGVSGTYQIDCGIDVAVVEGREKISGLELEVGKPRLATFHDTLSFKAEAGKSVFLFEKSSVSNYQLLILLRTSPQGDNTAVAANKGTLTVTIDRDGIVTCNGKQVTEDELLVRLNQQGATDRDTPVVIKADEASQLKKLAFVMDAGRKAGLTKFSLQSR